jgi:hypothetical protein
MIAPNILQEDFYGISQWLSGDAGNGVSEISPAGYLRLDGNAHANPNGAVRAKITINPPATFTLEIKLKHTALGTIANLDSFSLFYYSGTWKFNVTIAKKTTTYGLYITSAAGANVEVGTNLVSLATDQTWRFQVNKTTPASATVNVFLAGTQVGTNADCGYCPGAWEDGWFQINQLGYVTSDMLTVIDYIRVGTGLDVISQATPQIYSICL